MFSRIAGFLYGVVCYGISMAMFVYAMGFLANIGVAKSLDSVAYTPFGHALAVDIGLLLLFSIVGAWLARHEGFVVIQRVRQRLDRGEVPGRELIDGLLVLSGGVLLIVPGFVTDAFGLLLLFPPTRVLARHFLQRRFAVQTYGGPPSRRPPGNPPSGTGRDDIIDL